MDLSIVIPAYNEVDKVAGDIALAGAFLVNDGLSGEVIVVDDGSDDGTGAEAEKAERVEGVDVKVVRYEKNRGKGYAVKQGMAVTSGEFVMFADCGGCVPYEDAMRGLRILRSDEADIAHASRRTKCSEIYQKQSPFRQMCSWAFRHLMVHWMGIGHEYTDTQCGFKLYKGDVGRELYAECVTEGFLFDVEVILRAQRAGYRIKEFPIEWTCDLDSRLHPVRNSVELFREMMIIRRRHIAEGKAKKGD